MLRWMVLGIAMILSSPAFSSCELSSARANNTLIKVGDSDRRVIEAKADRVVRLTTSRGGSAGTRYDFYQRDVTIQIYVGAGVVTRICRIRD